jgi:hypothetical protein
MLTKSRTHIRIPRREWEKLRKNPQFNELVELLEDRADFEAARWVKGRITHLSQYRNRRKHERI